MAVDRGKNIGASSPLIKSLSDCEDDSAEGAALNQVTQSISRFRQGRVVQDDDRDVAFDLVAQVGHGEFLRR
jgi:hypothetical protein